MSLVPLSVLFIARRDDFQIAPSVRRCEKLASGRPGRRNRLPHLPCCPKVCKLGGAGGFACRANFSNRLGAQRNWSTPGAALQPGRCASICEPARSTPPTQVRPAAVELLSVAPVRMRLFF